MKKFIYLKIIEDYLNMAEIVLKIEIPEELRKEYKKLIKEELKMLKLRQFAKLCDRIVSKKSKISIKDKEFWELVKEIKEGVAKKLNIV